MRKYLEKRTINFFAKILLDLILYNLSYVVSVWLRFDFFLNLRFLHIDDFLGIMENVLFVILELLLKLPWHIWEYTSIKEFFDLVVAVSTTKFIVALYFYIFRPPINWSKGILLISWFVALSLLLAVRLTVRILSEKLNRLNISSNTQKRKKKVLIIGAGDAGEKVIREILARPDLRYQIVGILDDNPRKKGKKLHGYTIFGEIGLLPKVVEEKDVDIIIFAIPSAPREVLRKVVNLAAKTRAEIKSLPGIWEIIDGKVHVSEIKNVQLEDLLPRPSIKLDFSKIRSYISNQTILVTGAGGSIGSEIARQLADLNPKQIILLDRAENKIFEIQQDLIYKKQFKNIVPLICDIRDREKVFKIFEMYRPVVVFHAAAHKHVPLMEVNPDEAVLNNIFGTKNLLDGAIQYQVMRFVNISTDKAVNPINIMGASKRVIELMIKYYSKQANNTIFTSVRFGNVLGSEGSVIEVFKKQIKETGVITITDPRMERYFMLIPEAVQLVLFAGALDNEGGNIYVLKMGEQIKIMELAETFVKLSGFTIGKDVQIKIIGNRGREKISEELWSASEIVEETEIPYILKVRQSSDNLSPEEFFNLLEQLKKAALEMDSENIRDILMKIIPEAQLK